MESDNSIPVMVVKEKKRGAIMTRVASLRNSRKLILIMVSIGLLLDNMLLTVVVPIVPELLYNIRNPDNPISPQSHEALIQERVPCNNLSVILDQNMDDTPCLIDNATLPIALTQRNLEEESLDVGLMFASKAFVQLIINPFVGPLTHKIGYTIPMFSGLIILFLSTLMFAFGNTYAILFTARSFQGIGSAFSTVAGMGMIAEHYKNDKERGKAMGIALGGLALGILIGPPFGGTLYQLVGKTTPFLILAAMTLAITMLQLVVIPPAVVRVETKPSSIKSLVSDPLVIIAAASITVANLGIAVLEPSLPIWMIENLGSSAWEQGLIFLPSSISYLIGTNLFGPLGHKIGRWLCALLGLVVIGVCLLLIPMATSLIHLVFPSAGLGLAIGMVDSSMMPELGFLADIRHTSVYGSIYAIGDIAFCLGFAVGPALSGSLASTLGFHWMLNAIAILCLLFAPLLLFLKSPKRYNVVEPTKVEGKGIDAENKVTLL